MGQRGRADRAIHARHAVLPEFTGVPLKTLLEDCGVDYKKARYVLAEGADGSSMTRTIPMEWSSPARSGRLRPERRNAAPGKRLPAAPGGGRAGRVLGQVAAPHRSGRQALCHQGRGVHYIDLLPDGLHRQYSSIQECKSVITTPSGGQTLLDKGFYNVSGLAWSGRGKIKQVDVSFDGGINWQTARLEGPIQNKALTRFNINWVWDGKPAILQSRAMDETGYVQPSYGQLRKVRGTKSIYHNNAIQSWKVVESGEVSNVQVL
jgi:sulfane dehydrogenase subunit SoxC